MAKRPAKTRLKVGVLGTGEVGVALGTALATLGHEVCMGSRSAANKNAAAWAAKHGKRASHGTFADAAKFGDIVVFATLGTANAEVVKAAGVAAFAGKVVIDASNPLDYAENRPPDLKFKGNDSGGEMLQRLLPQAHVVKAFNIVPSALMFRPKLKGGAPDMLIAGNDAAAKKTVTKILTDFGWKRVIDIGGIDGSRWLEALCILWVLACRSTGNWRQAFRLLSS